MTPTASSMAQVRRLTTESARFNIGLIQRTLNTPTLALLFLDPTFQRQFTFEQAASGDPTLGFREALTTDIGDVWVVEYVEAGRPTLFRGKGDVDLPARGRFWIHAGDGRVVASELTLKDPEVEATVDVLYHDDSAVGQAVPVEMRELYSDLYGSSVEGTATYSNFRRFQVQVEEVMPPEQEPRHEPVRN